MAVNNEIGSIQPIHDIAALPEDRPTVSFHVDAVQALAKEATEVYLPERGIFVTFSSHKFHGLRGVGFVYTKEGKDHPLLTGGGQEREMRSTTENVAGIAATASPTLSHGKPRSFCQQDPVDEKKLSAKNH